MRWYAVGPSPIHGMGRFATRHHVVGEFIEEEKPAGHVEIEGCKVPYYSPLENGESRSPGFNFSCEANLNRRLKPVDGWLVVRPIAPGDELTLDMFDPEIFGPVTPERRAVILERWERYKASPEFKCNCPKCKKTNQGAV